MNRMRWHESANRTVPGLDRGDEGCRVVVEMAEDWEELVEQYAQTFRLAAVTLVFQVKTLTPRHFSP